MVWEWCGNGVGMVLFLGVDRVTFVCVCKGWIPASAGTTGERDGNDRRKRRERQERKTGTTGDPFIKKRLTHKQHIY